MVQKTGKMLPRGSISAATFGWWMKQNKTWKHGSISPCINGSGYCWWCNDFFLAHLVPLVPTEHHLKADYCCWPCPSLCNNTASSDVCFQQDNTSCHKPQVISYWFLERDNEFTVLKWLLQWPDLSPIDHLRDVIELHGCAVSKTAQLCDALM